MDNHSPLLPEATLATYRAASYSVATPRAVPLKVGVTSSDMTQLLRQRNVQAAALITAENPFGQKTHSPAKNKKANSALLNRIQQMGLTWLPGQRKCGQACEETESSYFVFGISGAQAEALMIEFEQTVLLWFSAGKTAELMLHPKARRPVLA